MATENIEPLEIIFFMWKDLYWDIVGCWSFIAHTSVETNCFSNEIIYLHFITQFAVVALVDSVWNLKILWASLIWINHLVRYICYTFSYFWMRCFLNCLEFNCYMLTSRKFHIKYFCIWLINFRFQVALTPSLRDITRDKCK